MRISIIETVERIVNISNPVIRNLNITQCYHELSQGMVRLIGSNPNWCTFAVWASKQAGVSIRKEDLKRSFEYYFIHSPEAAEVLGSLNEYSDLIKDLPEITKIKKSIFNTIDIDVVFERSTEAVAEGNKKVFEEIGKEFARFLSIFIKDDDFSDENINRFCSELKPGDPPDGQELLKKAFTAYHEAKLKSDPKEKAELIHYANLLTGFHEQTRLQPEIIDAMNAPIGNTDELRYKVFKYLLPGFWFRIRYFIAGIFSLKLPLDNFLDEILNLLKQQARDVVTRYLMSLSIPGSPMLRLGRNLPVQFPEILRQIKNEKLIMLLSGIDPTPDSPDESGTKDWGNFDDRMHFIADFFRAFYVHNPLFNPPFDDEQVLIFKAGQKPPGIL